MHALDDWTGHGHVYSKDSFLHYRIEAFTDLEILLEILFPVEILLVHGFLE